MRLPLSLSRRLVVAVALVALVVAALLAPGAGARRTIAVIPNGVYGVNAPNGEYVVFTVKNRKVRNLNFQMQITCQASDEPTSEQRLFAGGAQAPQGRRIPDSGKLTLKWQESGNGRYGQISVELKFGLRDVANFAVIVPEDRFAAGPDDTFEMCDGVSSLRFHRGYELMPTSF